MVYLTCVPFNSDTIYYINIFYEYYESLGIYTDPNNIEYCNSEILIDCK